METLKKVLLLAGLSASLAACQMVGSSDEIPAEDLPLVGPTWQLISFRDASGYASSVTEELLTVIFEKGGKFGAKGLHLGGTSAHNAFGGTYVAGKDSSLSMNAYGGTFAGVPDGSRYLDFLTALEHATSYEIEGDRLRITYGNGKTLVFMTKISNEQPR